MTGVKVFMNGTKVFLSISNGYRKDQLLYEKDLRNFILQRTHVEPVTVSCLCNKGESPLLKVIESIRESDLLIALALERKHTYLEFQKEKSLFDRIEKNNIYYTSPWIHIECAIAKALNKPILLLLPSNVEPEGVIDLTQDDYSIITVPTISKNKTNLGAPRLVKFNSYANKNCRMTIEKFLDAHFNVI